MGIYPSKHHHCHHHCHHHNRCSCGYCFDCGQHVGNVYAYWSYPTYPSYAYPYWGTPYSTFNTNVQTAKNDTYAVNNTYPPIKPSNHQHSLSII